jgi:DNA-binding ferritin-like protein (Dps family)
MEEVGNDLKAFVEELRNEWRYMWRTRIDDDVRAEAIAEKTFTRLFVDRGLILFATRDYKPPIFHEILERHLTPEEIERASPSPVRGGIKKFIKEYITIQNGFKNKRRQEMRAELEKMKRRQQQKHGGRGWLHYPSVGEHSRST